MVLVTISDDGVLMCNRCGTLEADLEQPDEGSAAYDHLLDHHRPECVAAHSEIAVARVRQMF